MKQAMSLFSLIILGCAGRQPAVVSPPTTDLSTPTFTVVEGENCGELVLISKRIVKQNTQAVCDALDPWMIARVASGGSLSGSGYNCELKKKDDRNLGHSICTQLLKVSGDASNDPTVCPQGTVVASTAEASKHREQFCQYLGDWDIVRLNKGASLSGPGYNCQIISNDERTLGHSLCH